MLGFRHINALKPHSKATLEIPDSMSTHHSISLALADLPEGQMHACSAGGREIVVCNTKSGVFAVDNVCTHAYARLNEGRLRGCRLICPLHGAAFDVRDGRALGAPASRPLATHAVAIVDDRIEISVAHPESR